MPLKLRVLAGSAGDQSSGARPRTERPVEIDEQLAEIRLGRRAGLELELPFPALSAIHARLVRAGADWHVEDLDSVNGSWLDGVRLAPGQSVPIRPGATLRLANVSLRFEGISPSSSPSSSSSTHAEGTATIARRLVSDLFQSGAGGQAPRLIVLVGPSSLPAQPLPEPLRLAVPDHWYLIGRGETCDLILPSDEISREHAVLVRRWQGVHIRDLGSKNGVHVAGQPIAGDHRLRDGDQLEIGAMAFTLDDPEDRYLQQIESTLDTPAIDSSPDAATTSAPASEGSHQRSITISIAVAAVVLVAVTTVALLLLFGS